MSEKAYYITTPIYYVNDVPHIGNAYTTIVADVIARYQRLLGREVVFATGTDEHAIKVAEAAQQKGLPTSEFVDQLAEQFKAVWGELGLSYDVFIRTTEPRHVAVVQEAFRRLRDKGDIYKGVYEGWYCVPDETFFREGEITDGKCPNPWCGRPVQWVQEETYYFRLSAYQDILLRYIEEHPDFLQPEFRKNEVLSFIRQGLQDVSITRGNQGWGIPVPDEPDKVIYVWFDALLNYITIAGWNSDDTKFDHIWPADIQLMGKDIFVRFHSTLWPAMLMGLGIELPKVLFGHGFWSIEGEKISKSKGNAISPAKLAEDLAASSGASKEVALDAVKFFLLREVPFGQDGDFSYSSLVSRFNSELANDLGNLLNRTLSMLSRYLDGVIPDTRGTGELKEKARESYDRATEAMSAFKFSEALDAIWDLIGAGNKFLDSRAPWRLYKEGKNEELAAVLYDVLEAARVVTVMISPFLPKATDEMRRQLGLGNDLKWSDAGEWGLLPAGTQTQAAEPVFPRIDDKKNQKAEKEARVEKPVEKPVEEAPKQQYLSFDDFKKVELRVAEIKTAEKVEGADKLLKLQVSLGDEDRQIVAGIAQYYEPESLVGKKVVIIANLAPARIRGVESQGMLLAADIEGRAVILTPDSDVPAGSKVR